MFRGALQGVVGAVLVLPPLRRIARVLGGRGFAHRLRVELERHFACDFALNHNALPRPATPSALRLVEVFSRHIWYASRNWAKPRRPICWPSLIPSWQARRK